MGGVTRRPLRIASVGMVLAAGLLCLAPGPALAQAPQATPDEVYRKLGLADIATEYVVLVDVSRSMSHNGRYDSLKSGLRTFVGGLKPNDGFTLITFDADPHVLHHGPVTSVDDRLWGMPEVPKGTATDVGAALDEAVKTLEGTPPTTAGAVVLFTDALNAPKPTSRYAAADEEAWDDLERRGTALGSRVSGYVVPLSSGESGVDELRRTIPDTTALELNSAVQVESFLGSLTDRVRRSMARAKARDELAAPIEVRWSSVPRDNDLESGVRLTATLRSTTTAMPLEVVPRRVTVAGVAATVDGLPHRVTLEPGKDVDVGLTVRATVDGGFSYRATTSRIDARLSAEVTTPWRDVLVNELGLPGALPSLTAPTRWSSTIVSGVHPLLVVGPIAVLLAALMVLVFRWHRRNPYLSGSLDAVGADGAQVHRDLEGRRADRFPRPSSRRTPEELRGEFRIRGVRIDGAVVPQIVYHPEGGAAYPPRELVDDHTNEMYGMSMRLSGSRR